MELQPIPNAAVPDVVARRIEVFQQGDKRRRSIEVTGRGWIVRYRRAGYELPT